MKHINSRINKLIGILITSSIMLGGCGIMPSVSLEDDQNELIAEYAAGLIMKYEKGHTNGMVKDEDLDMVDLYTTPTPTPILTPEPEIVEEEDNVSDEPALVSDIGGDSSGGGIDISMIPLNEAFGLNDLQIDFSYMELCDTYPSSEADMVFAMNATSGNDLMIMHFNLFNPNGMGMDCAVSRGDYKIRALVNGSDRIRGELTFLENDLSNFAGYIDVGETKDVVLVFEIPEETEVSSLDLLLVGGGKELRYPL